MLSEVCISNLQREIWQLNRGKSHGKSGAIFSTFTHGLCSYNVRRLNDDVTVIEFSYWRRRESPKLHTADRGGI